MFEYLQVFFKIVSVLLELQNGVMNLEMAVTDHCSPSLILRQICPERVKQSCSHYCTEN